MKDSLNYIEITALVRELSSLKGAKVNKVYNPSKKELIFNLHHPEQRKVALRAVLPRYMTVSEYKQGNPEKPSHFAMFLRKYLTNAKLVGISQPPFERIIELHFEKEDYFILVFELFSKGNVIICDKDYKILLPLEAQSWRDREIRAGVKYVFPQKSMNFENMSFENFKYAIVSSKRDEIVKALAIVLGLGGTYAEELCHISGINKKTKINAIKDDEFRLLFKNFLSIVENSKESELQPHIVFKEKEAIDVLPFKLDIYSDYETKEYPSFEKALDSYFMTYFKEKKISIKETNIEKEVIHQEAILKQHRTYLEELKTKSEKYKIFGDKIYQHLGEIQDIVQNLNSARDKNIEWDEIIKKIEDAKSKGNKEANLIKEIIPDQGVLIINVEEDITINFKQTVTENANSFYTKAKKMESKIFGVETAIMETEEKIEELKQKKANVENLVESQSPVKIEKIQEEWYERFHWFVTSGGKLAIGGRDATQNEVVVNKHTEPNDIVFHTEDPGSPFLILKNGKEASAEEKREAAIFVLCNSRAWKEKRISKVYAVRPEQLSKKAPAGEYIARGGFMIYGKKEYIKDIELRYAVGVQIEPFKVISGPVDNVRLKARYYAILIPGEENKDEIAKSIKAYWLNMSRQSDKPIIEGISLEIIKKHSLESSDIFGLIK